MAFATPIPAGAPASKRDIKLGDFVAPHVVKPVEDALEFDDGSGTVSETGGQPESNAVKARRHAQPTPSNPFVTAWHLVYKAVKARAPDTKVGSLTSFLAT